MMNFYISIRSLSASLMALLIVLPAVYASDLEKEKRWADQVVDAIIDGDAVWLNDGSSKILGIYTEAETDSSRAVIVMHGTGIHPDWQQVIQPLRVGLTEHGWNTLSIQMPVLANDAAYIDYAPLYDEAAPRIEAAIKFLHAEGNKEVVLIGHSQGAAMAAYYLAQSSESKLSQAGPSQTKSSQPIAGFVAIGIAAFAQDERMDSIHSLQKIRIPVLDLYGKEDLENIVASAEERIAASEKAGNKNYTQRVIAGNHFFDGQDEALIETVEKWLSSISNP